MDHKISCFYNAVYIFDRIHRLDMTFYVIKAHISSHYLQCFVDISVNGNYWQLNDSEKHEKCTLINCFFGLT